jgi:hypothetical protein
MVKVGDNHQVLLEAVDGGGGVAAWQSLAYREKEKTCVQLACWSVCFSRPHHR